MLGVYYPGEANEETGPARSQARASHPLLFFFFYSYGCSPCALRASKTSFSSKIKKPSLSTSFTIRTHRVIRGPVDVVGKEGMFLVAKGDFFCADCSCVVGVFIGIKCPRCCLTTSRSVSTMSMNGALLNVT